MAGVNRRAIQYVQQLDHLKFDSVDLLLENIDEHIKENNLDYDYACILHDKDIDDEGKLLKPHIHIQFYCENKLSSKELKAMTKESNMHYFEYMDNKIESFKYLIHATKNSESKYQYSQHDVKANFDYVDYIQNARSESENLDSTLRDIINGRITYRDIAKNNQLNLEYVKHRQKFDNAFQIALEKKAQTDEGNSVSTIWIHSTMSGIGKTYLAKQKAKEYIENVGKEMSIYQTSAGNDLFQYYKGEEIIIIDDFRSSDISYHELLRLLDPHNSTSVRSRYSNKVITADLIIITSMLSPFDYYAQVVDLMNQDNEPIDQLLRRLTYVLELFRPEESNKKEYLSTFYVYSTLKDDRVNEKILGYKDYPIKYTYVFKTEKKRWYLFQTRKME